MKNCCCGIKTVVLSIIFNGRGRPSQKSPFTFISVSLHYNLKCIFIATCHHQFQSVEKWWILCPNPPHVPFSLRKEMWKWQNSELHGIKGLCKIPKPHHNQPIKPLNQKEYTQDAAQLKCDPGAGRHITIDNEGNLKMSCNLILINFQGNSGAECECYSLFFLSFLADASVQILG